MKFLTPPKEERFTNKQLIVFLLPVLFEQLMVAGLGMADTFMVSFLGETAVAGVALVNRIDNFAKQFFVALAQGGSVVLSQYIGAKNNKLAQVSLKSNIRIVVTIGICFTLVMVLFKNQVLQLLYGGAAPDVLAISSTYFTVTAFSYPFIALYYAGLHHCDSSMETLVPVQDSDGIRLESDNIEGIVVSPIENDVIYISSVRNGLCCFCRCLLRISFDIFTPLFFSDNNSNKALSAVFSKFLYGMVGSEADTAPIHASICISSPT